MVSTQLVKVIIPIYKNLLSEDEQLSLDRCFQVLHRYDICFVIPEGLDTTSIEMRYGKRKVYEFNKSYFEGLKGYNQLMLSSEFYEAFLDTQYILIHQTDVFVFRDELEQWCNHGFDYIGAPWIPKRKYSRWYYHLFFGLKKGYNRLFKASDYTDLFYKVGNGGFSLRKVVPFFEIAKDDRKTIEKYITQCNRNRFNEDVFWGIEVNRKEHRLRIPSWREAIAFAFDKLPEEAYQIHGHQLPFGCHGWNKPAMLPFWHPIIDKITRLNNKKKTF